MIFRIRLVLKNNNHSKQIQKKIEVNIDRGSWVNCRVLEKLLNRYIPPVHNGEQCDTRFWYLPRERNIDIRIVIGTTKNRLKNAVKQIRWCVLCSLCNFSSSPNEPVATTDLQFSNLQKNKWKKFVVSSDRNHC